MKKIDFLPKAVSLLSILIFQIITSFSQPAYVWAKQIGDIDLDQGRSIAVDASGNVYTTGYFSKTVDFDPNAGTFNMVSDSGTIDMFVSKLDAAGNFLWAKQISGTDIDEGDAMVLDAAGNIYITGSFFGTTDFDIGAGTFNLTSAGDRDIFILKLDSSGDLVWVKQIGELNADYGLSIAVDASGNVYTSGAFQMTADFDPGAGTANMTSAGSYDVFISKLNSSGNFVWAKQMGGANDDYGNSIALDGAGNIYLAGSFNGTMDADPGAATLSMTSTGDDIFVSKFDNSGNLVWAKQLAGSGNEQANAVTVDASGNVCTSGVFDGTVDFDPGAAAYNLSVLGLRDLFVSKLNPSGNFLWAKQMGGTAPFADYSSSVAVDLAGNVYTTGMFFGTVDFDPGAGSFNMTSGANGTAGYYGDVFISELDASGNFMNAGLLGAGGTNDNIGLSIAVDGIGNIYTTGSFDGIGDFDPGSGTASFTGTQDIFISKLNGSSSVGISENVISGKEISVYPNPSAGKFYLNNDALSVRNTIHVYNTSGELLPNINASSNGEIDLTGYPKGIYFLHVNTGNTSSAEKIILE